LKINSNINAYVAANALSKNQRVMDTAMERLSTGVRINSAADDAAGLAITSKMTSQIRGLNQAIRNVNDGIGMIQTADGSIKEAAELLQRMRELAVQSINGTNTAADRAALDTENQALKAEIDRIGATTQWNGINLLSSDNTVSLQVGANANDTLNVNFNTISGATLGVSAVGGGYVTHSSIAPTLVTVAAGSPAGSINANVVSLAYQTRDVSAADFNNDGHMDIAVAADSTFGGHSLAVYNNDGSTNFTEQALTSSSQVYASQAHKVNSISNIDLDGDGDLDLVTGDWGTGTIEWWENDGAGSFILSYVVHDGASAADATAADLDGDGDMDVIALMNFTGQWMLRSELLWFRNDGNQNFSSATQIGDNQFGGGALVTGDFNGDGYIDLVSTDYNSYTLKIMTNDGIGNFSQTLLDIGDRNTRTGEGLEATDLDGDGDIDLLVGDRHGGKIYWLDNDGTGTFTQKYLGAAYNVSGLAAADLDGDGDIDIAAASMGSSSFYMGHEFLWLENDGSENFISHVVDSDYPSLSKSVAIADVNGDGVPDIIGAKYYNRSGASWYDLNLLNTGVSTLDFGNLGLSLDDRVTLTVAGGSEIQHVVGVGGISQLLTDLAADLAAQSSLYSGATVSNNIITINGLADGSPLAGITVTLESPSLSISTINLLSASSAASGLSLIDESLNSISTYRASFGATLNRLEYSADNLSNAVQNTSASRSRIEDADYAKESTELARSQIIQQAAMAMLVQANQQPNQVLELLKSI